MQAVRLDGLATESCRPEASGRLLLAINALQPSDLSAHRDGRANRNPEDPASWRSSICSSRSIGASPAPAAHKLGGGGGGGGENWQRVALTTRPVLTRAPAAAPSASGCRRATFAPPLSCARRCCAAKRGAPLDWAGASWIQILKLPTSRTGRTIGATCERPRNKLIWRPHSGSGGPKAAPPDELTFDTDDRRAATKFVFSHRCRLRGFAASCTHLKAQNNNEIDAPLRRKAAQDDPLALARACYQPCNVRAPVVGQRKLDQLIRLVWARRPKRRNLVLPLTPRASCWARETIGADGARTRRPASHLARSLGDRTKRAGRLVMFNRPTRAAAIAFRPEWGAAQPNAFKARTRAQRKMLLGGAVTTSLAPSLQCWLHAPPLVD